MAGPDGVVVPVGSVVVVPVVVPVVPEPLVPLVPELVPELMFDGLVDGAFVVDECEVDPALDPQAAASAIAPIGRSSFPFMVQPSVRAGRSNWFG